MGQASLVAAKPLPSYLASPKTSRRHPHIHDIVEANICGHRHVGIVTELLSTQFVFVDSGGTSRFAFYTDKWGKVL